ncbi:glycosyltransferase family 2 protein [Marinoscillum pacificum]|uniref:glycosyltransferase family 2 protein n=1 Tax=Marinoscillum pacificum TaxID=392723 RepID=UPI002157D6DA|nr:glycosyltransferase family 2 protein [Marinoscillum pacificum]
MTDKDHQPLISVIIPTYNRERYILEAVNSVLSQTYGNIELIVVDDGSTDQTKELIGSVRDPRLDYYRIDHIGHISSVRNIGLERCGGEYIAFLDSDDVWKRDKLAKQLNYLNQTEANAVISSYDILDSDETIETKLINPESNQNGSQYILQNLLMNTISIYISTALIHCSVLKDVKGFSTTTSISEVDFIGRILVHHKTVVYLDSLVTIRKHQANISSQTTILNLFKEKFKMIDDLHDNGHIDRSTYNQSIINHIYSCLMQGKHELKMAEKFSLFVDCHKIRPMSLKHFFMLTRSLI